MSEEQPSEAEGREEYRVGPGRPPREHQFRKGQSGNPGGRPKNESVTATIRRMLQGEHHGRPIQDILVERMIREALSGTYPFLRELLDRAEGKPNQKIEVATETPLVYIKVPPPRVIGEKDADDLPDHTKVIRGVEPDDI
jgi:hypothetical protein